MEEASTELTAPFRKHPKSLGELEREYHDAVDALQQREDEESIARRNTTQCKNRVNEAQKALTAAMKELREEAPRDTAWRRSDFPKEPACN